MTDARSLTMHLLYRLRPRASRRNDVREFEFGLDLILNGLEKIRTRPEPRPLRRCPHFRLVDRRTR
jgi:hypothetical protein